MIKNEKKKRAKNALHKFTNISAVAVTLYFNSKHFTFAVVNSKRSAVLATVLLLKQIITNKYIIVGVVFQNTIV